MYITITPQNTGANYSQSAADFVNYLEKENEQLPVTNQEYFFNQYSDAIKANEVTEAIDKNTTKLKRKEPKFYSITINPGSRELKHLKADPLALKQYTREVMKVYAASFNREINGRKVTVDDLLYFAKIEHQRFYKGRDRQIIENQPYANQILELKHQMRLITKGEQQGNLEKLQHQLNALERQAPHQINGQRMVQGMPKEGPQEHIHIIISRKDISNSVSLSPGSKYKASEVVMNGKIVKRGFDRDGFFSKAESVFDKLFAYRRNYAETYQARKIFIKDTKLFFNTLMGLPANEKATAFQILRKAGMPIPNTPALQLQLAIKTLKKLKKGLQRAIRSGAIEL